MPEDVYSGGFYIWGIPTIIRSGRPQYGFAALAGIVAHIPFRKPGTDPLAFRNSLGRCYV